MLPIIIESLVEENNEFFGVSLGIEAKPLAGLAIRRCSQLHWVTQNAEKGGRKEELAKSFHW